MTFSHPLQRSLVDGDISAAVQGTKSSMSGSLDGSESSGSSICIRKENSRRLTPESLSAVAASPCLLVARTRREASLTRAGSLIVSATWSKGAGKDTETDRRDSERVIRGWMFWLPRLAGIEI